MFDPQAAHADLMKNLDGLLEKVASRKAAAAPPASVVATSTKLANDVASLQLEAAQKTAELKQIIAKKAARRAEKVAEARHITRVAFGILAA